ncbi:MAG: YihY/virulence factor BrkB family protein [Chloroflexi bacterium]|nr:YihY/virulence factor BrkB family protein [Chloroflexota bacterium]
MTSIHGALDTALAEVLGREGKRELRLIPRRPSTPRITRRAALVSAVLWEVAKIAFAFFTKTLDFFQAYGALALAAGLLTWIYLTAIIILIGAEVMKTQRTSRAVA